MTGGFTLSAHCRALTQLNFTPLDFSHRCRTLQNTSVLEHGLSLIILSSVAKFLRKPTITCAFHVSTQLPDLTDSHEFELSGRARTPGATAYTWRQKINT